MSTAEATEGTAKKAAILILEDEWLVALDLADEVATAGYEVVGPVHSVDAALDLIRAGVADAAFLDVNLGRETSYPVADALVKLSIPFAFLTGYAPDQIESRFHDWPVLAKPVLTRTLRLQLEKLTRGL